MLEGLDVMKVPIAVIANFRQPGSVVLAASPPMKERFEDMIPHITAIEGSKNSLADSNLKGEEALFEERRIAYVCATRAKKLLYLSVPKLYHSKEKSPSRFILEGLRGEEIEKEEKVERTEETNSIIMNIQEVVAYFKRK